MENYMETQKLSVRRGTITTRQIRYLCALYSEATKNLFTLRSRELIGLDMAHPSLMSARDASHYIGVLVAAKKREWKVA